MDLISIAIDVVRLEKRLDIILETIAAIQVAIRGGTFSKIQLLEHAIQVRTQSYSRTHR